MELNHAALKELLSEELLSEQSVLVNEYSFFLGDITARIKVRIYYDAYRERDPYRFSLSHYIKTPMQAGPYIPSTPWTGSEATALGRGLDSLTRQYNHAVENGHIPSETWLVKASD
jgi:hypothetical protein